METKRVCPSCRKTLPPNAPLGLCPECLIKSGFATGTDPANPGKESGFVPPPAEEIAKLFPQLEVLELIGKGGMGAVYKARQRALDRFVALKILPPDSAKDAGFAERFNREARALARLNHPHIVAVHDFGRAELPFGQEALPGVPTAFLHYLIMEFVDGLNLRQVEQAGHFTPEQALEIVPQICEALQFAHNEGVVHRDIKPENILLDKKGRVKITDFGIAKILGVPTERTALTGAKDLIGTPHYMAPEQIEKPQTVDHRADIYSLGVVFYELLTGELPIGKFQPPSRKVQVDVRLDEVVLHALEKEPARRYQQASEVKADVETIAHTQDAAPVASAPVDFAAISSVEAAARQVKGPAIGLVVAGILNWIAIPLIAMVTAAFVGGKNLDKSLLIWVPLMALGFSSVMIVAGLKMKRLEAHGLALTGSILAMLVTPGNVIGLPIGIWALVVLSHREVRAAFGKNLPLTQFQSPPFGRGSGVWKVAAVIVGALMLALALPVGAILLGVFLPSLSRAKARLQPESSLAVAPPNGGGATESKPDLNGLSEDVAAVSSEGRFAGGDTNKLYFLIGHSDRAASQKPQALLLVLPGGDGGRDFQPFVKRIFKNALPEDYLVAQLVAPTWDENQSAQLVWPTESNHYPAMKFSTEAFVAAVIADVEKRHRLDPSRIFTLSWSSGGPAGYAVSLHPDTRVTGSFIAMSVFKPDALPSIGGAKGRAYYLLHSPADFIPMRMAELARDTLAAHGANVRLQTYDGGHGWHGDVFGMIGGGVRWLEQQSVATPGRANP